VINSLLMSGRIRRMSEPANAGPGDAYTPLELLADLREGVFEELDGDEIAIGYYGRNLHRAYLGKMIELFEGLSTNSDLSALARTELIEVQTALESAIPRASALERAHLHDLLGRIERAFDQED
jgi:hypothetical protein